MRPFFVAALAFVTAGTANATIINIDASHGFTFDSGGSDPAPVPGQHINPIGTPVTLALGPGTYKITNAYGKSGALFNAWSYNVGTSSWAWAFVIANAATGNTVNYYEAGGGSSAAQVAALAAVQNFSATLTLASSQTLQFTLRDYYVPDNAGGISIDIQRESGGVGGVPEPASWMLMIGGFGVAGTAMRRRRAALRVTDA